MATDKLKVEYLPLDELRHFPKNAKLHGDEALIGSIERFTFADPVLLGTHPEASFILAGHGRCIALAKMRDGGNAPPQHIAVDGKGKWLVPVVKLALPPGEAEAFVLAHNRIGEKGDPELGAWDNDMLTDVLRELESFDVDLSGLGWDAGEIADFLDVEPENTGTGEGEEPPPNKAEELQEKWGTELGQMWQCGEHRIVCGDCTDKAVVERVMGGGEGGAAVHGPTVWRVVCGQERFSQRGGQRQSGADGDRRRPPDAGGDARFLDRCLWNGC